MVQMLVGQPGDLTDQLPECLVHQHQVVDPSAQMVDLVARGSVAALVHRSLGPELTLGSSDLPMLIEVEKIHTADSVDPRVTLTRR